METKIKKINNLKRKILNVYIIISFITFILFIIFAISSDFVSSALFLIMTIGYIITYFISKYIYLTWLGKLQYIFIFIPILLAIYFSKTDLYFKLSIYNLNTVLIDKMEEQDNQIYRVKNNNIFDNKYNTIFEYDFSVMINEGEVIVKNKKIGYKLEIKHTYTYETKCVIKDFDSKKYEIFDGNCEECKANVNRVGE